MTGLLLILSITAFVLLRAQSQKGAQDLTLKNRTSICGRAFSEIVLVMKPGKFRREMRLDSGNTYVNLYDCSKLLHFEVNDRNRTYIVHKMSSAPPSTEKLGQIQADPATLTRTVDLHDTGERREFFGFTARHIKGTLTDKGGTGRCAKNGSFSVWLDGWYIDPPVPGCYWPTAQQMFRHPDPGCTDPVKVRVTDIDSLGYSMLDDLRPNNDERLSIHTETTSVSREPLDPNLFEVPAGYKEVHTYKEFGTEQTPATAQSSAPQ